MSDKRQKRIRLCFLLLAVLVLLLGALNLVTGSTSIGAGALWRALFSPDRDTGEARILWNIRMPRLLAAAVLGGALAVSGFLLQTFFANPIAGPFILGVSSGAKLVLSLVMIGFLSRGVVVGQVQQHTAVRLVLPGEGVGRIRALLMDFGLRKTDHQGDGRSRQQDAAQNQDGKQSALALLPLFQPFAVKQKII